MMPKKHIPIHTDSGTDSPYIVRLSYDPIEHLQNALIIDADLQEGYVEAPLVEAVRQDDLRVHFIEIESQAAESATPPPPEVIDAPSDFVFETPPSEEFTLISSPALVRRSPLRPFLAFALCLSVFILPLHAYNVFAHGTGLVAQSKQAGADGAASMLSASQALMAGDTSTATQDFSSAHSDFVEVGTNLDQIPASLSKLISVTTGRPDAVGSGTALATALQSLSLAGATFAQGLHHIEAQTDQNVAQKIQTLGLFAAEAEPDVATAQSALAGVDLRLFDADTAQKISDVSAQVQGLHAALQEYSRLAKTLATVFGSDEKRRYLVVFQNNAELRPTGGFMGSFAEVDVEHGNIEQFTVPTGGTYALEGQLTKFVAAPLPLQLLRARWEFQDTNWFPDFSLSSRKMLEFYEAAGGPSCDGVIAINASVLPDILALFGSVDLPEYGKTVNAENVLFEMQKAVEQDYDKTQNAPKAFVGSLANALMQKTVDPSKDVILGYAQVAAKHLENKDIQVYLSNNSEEAQIASFGVSGLLHSGDGDYFLPVSTNVGGGKTDTVIDQDIDLQVHIDADGTVTHTVTIQKTHHGLQDALFTGVNNVDYFRIYVPKGSTLVSASGFEPPDSSLFKTSDTPLDSDTDLSLTMQALRNDAATGMDVWEEQGRTVFGNWIQTKPGEIQVAAITYVTPQKIAPVISSDWLSKAKEFFAGADRHASYTMTIDNQSGADMRDVHLEVSAPSTWQTSYQTSNITDFKNASGFLGYIFKVPSP